MKRIDFPDSGVVTMLPIDLVSFLWVASAAAILFVVGAGVAVVAGFFRDAGGRANTDRPEGSSVPSGAKTHFSRPSF